MTSNKLEDKKLQAENKRGQILDYFKLYRCASIVAERANVSKQYVSSVLSGYGDIYELLKYELPDAAIVRTFNYYLAKQFEDPLAETTKRYRRHHKLSRYDVYRVLLDNKAIPKEADKLERFYNIHVCPHCKKGVMSKWGNPGHCNGIQYRCGYCHKYAIIAAV